MITNTVTTLDVAKKLLPKFRSPYEVITCLPNDRLVVTDIDGFQLAQTPYRGILEPSQMKPYST